MGPWLFPYVEEPHGTSRHSPTPLRPAVPVSVASVLEDDATPKLLALVDSGAEHTLAGPGVGRLANVDPSDAPTQTIGIGGRAREVYYGTVLLRLFQHVDSVDEPALVEWTASVGFIKQWEPPWGLLLGQKGFFDQFTVTISRHAQAIAIEPMVQFDDRFGYLFT